MTQKESKKNHSNEEYERIMYLFQDKVLQVLALLFVYIFTLIQVYENIKSEHIILKTLIIVPLLYLINEIDCLEKTRRYAENKCKLRVRIRRIEKEVFESLKKRDRMGHSLAFVSVFSFLLLVYLISNKNFLQNLTLKIPLINFEIPIEFWFLLFIGIIFWIFRVRLINKIFEFFEWLKKITSVSWF